MAWKRAEAEHTLLTTQTTKPFSSILYVSTVSSSFRILPVVGISTGVYV